jgi:hypothetical protein
MVMVRIQEMISVTIVVVLLCLTAALLWVGIGGLFACSAAGVLAGLALVTAEGIHDRHRH